MSNINAWARKIPSTTTRLKKAYSTRSEFRSPGTYAFLMTEKIDSIQSRFMLELDKHTT
jgi:hypothetical protein